MTKSVSYLAQTVMSNSIDNIRALQSFSYQAKIKIHPWTIRHSHMTENSTEHPVSFKSDGRGH
jgi:hypothetical protein